MTNVEHLVRRKEAPYFQVELVYYHRNFSVKTETEMCSNFKQLNNDDKKCSKWKWYKHTCTSWSFRQFLKNMTYAEILHYSLEPCTGDPLLTRTACSSWQMCASSLSSWLKIIMFSNTQLPSYSWMFCCQSRKKNMKCVNVNNFYPPYGPGSILGSCCFLSMLSRFVRQSISWNYQHLVNTSALLYILMAV